MRSISEDLFNKDIVDEYLCLLKNGKPCNPPSIVIEVVFSGEEDTVAFFIGATLIVAVSLNLESS